MGEMNAKQIISKLKRYEAWAKSEPAQQYLISLYREHGAKNPRSTFRVLFVCDDRASTGGMNRLSELMQIATSFPNSVCDALWFACVAELRSPRPRIPMLATATGVLVLCSTGMPSVVQPVARFTTSYVIAGFVDAIAGQGVPPDNVDARFFWPAFFAALSD